MLEKFVYLAIFTIFALLVFFVGMVKTFIIYLCFFLTATLLEKLDDDK
jgi:hypothetical protein